MQKLKRMKKRVDFRQLKISKMKKKLKNTSLDRKIEEAIALSELCQDLKKELENAKIIQKNN